MAYVLICDDDSDFANAAAMVLQADGHETHVELDPDGAKTSMAERTPDLLVLDVMFPEDDEAGFRMARELRGEHEAMAKVPILMLTAINTKFPLGFGEKDIDDAWLPVDGFLEKPVDLDVLKRRVGAMLKAGA